MALRVIVEPNGAWQQFCEVKVKGEEGCISLAQRPGSFYVGNLCALDHNVAHGASAQGSYGPPENKVQITVMLRSDLFREVRARKTDACI